jgi:isopenicillin-N epimerase
MEGVRDALGGLVGAQPGRVALLPNATSAINAVAQSLPLGRGDEVVVTDLEYGAMRLVWDEVSRRTGATIVVAGLPLPAASDTLLADAIWDAVTPRTRALFVSHITSETALLVPVEELCRRSRDAGIVSIVDGAHAPGQLDLDLTGLGADCYAGNCHKWLCAPKGSGFLYASDDAREWLGAPIVSWGWSWDHDAFQERFSWLGTDDPTALLAVPAAIDYQEANDWAEHRTRCATLARETQAVVLEAVGGDPIAPPELQAPQMVSFAVPFPDAEGLAATLREHGIEIPTCRVGERTLVRLSLQAYNTEDDAGRLVSALTTTASRNAKSR